MKTFTIDATNKIAVHSGDIEIASDGVKFTSETGFTDATVAWPASRLVDLWNNLPGAKPVAKFKDRNTAIRRIWAAVERRNRPQRPGLLWRPQRRRRQRRPPRDQRPTRSSRCFVRPTA
jgi:hypothetical protein